MMGIFMIIFYETLGVNLKGVADHDSMFINSEKIYSIKLSSLSFAVVHTPNKILSNYVRQHSRSGPCEAGTGADNRDGNKVVALRLHLNPNTGHAPADESILGSVIYGHVRRLKLYRQLIKIHYKPLQLELYNVHENFFVSSFLKAINELYPGLLTFEMLPSSFCEMLIAQI